jgi:hypothetical protein
MLFVVGAMAALSIDVVTLYTARSEAQLAADGAALAGARALANSGMTSRPLDMLLASNAEILASAVAIQVAQGNLVGGRNLVAANGEVNVTFPNFGSSGFGTDPHVTVRVQRTDLPTFFARIWGRTAIAVAASATAEAYNPSGASIVGQTAIPVAPMCVKPWLLPNIDPSNTASPGQPIFNPATGAIQTTTLLGWTSSPGGVPMSLACTGGDCSVVPLPTPSTAGWQYYPGDPNTTFPPPTQELPDCVPAMTTPYQQSIAGCIQTPISCNSQANIDITNDPNRNRETARAVNCLSHARTNLGDQVEVAPGPVPPFQFIAGADNPIALVNPLLAGNNEMVSDSLVTVPVFDVGAGPPFNPPMNPVQIIGFVQLFVNPDGRATRPWPPNAGQVKTTVINMAGCGTAAAGQSILGEGTSPVAVRLISPP